MILTIIEIDDRNFLGEAGDRSMDISITYESQTGTGRQIS
jgi:hypothetical protein